MTFLMSRSHRKLPGVVPCVFSFSSLEGSYRGPRGRSGVPPNHSFGWGRLWGPGAEVTKKKYAGDLTVVSPAFCALVHRLAVSAEVPAVQRGPRHRRGSVWNRRGGLVRGVGRFFRKLFFFGTTHTHKNMVPKVMYPFPPKRG